jgi:plastocyanin
MCQVTSESLAPVVAGASMDPRADNPSAGVAVIPSEASKVRTSFFLARHSVVPVAAMLAFATALYGAGSRGDRRSAPPRPHATGRIAGTVEISTALTARRPQIRIYADPGSGALPPAPPRDPIAAEVRNVVIYLEGDSSTLPGSTEQVARRLHGSVAQHGERFVPHVLAVMQGGTVDFPNQDDIYHNVFSLSAAAGNGGFDLGRYPKGSSRSWTFPKPGTVQVFCHIHQDMSAILLVLANPFFATPDENHHYSIDDVPEGDYTLVAWHERIKPPITRLVHVVAGQTAVVDFNIPLPQGGPR